MAIWHYKLVLYSREFVVEEYEEIPQEIPFHVYERGSEPIFLTDEQYEQLPNYWLGREWAETCNTVLQFLPEIKSWSEDLRMFGDKASNRVEVWSEEFYVLIDCRDLDTEFVRIIIELSKVLDAIMVDTESGKVIQAELNDLLSHMEHSIAVRFTIEPEKVLAELGKSQTNTE